MLIRDVIRLKVSHDKVIKMYIVPPSHRPTQLTGEVVCRSWLCRAFKNSLKRSRMRPTYWMSVQVY